MKNDFDILGKEISKEDAIYLLKQIIKKWKNTEKNKTNICIKLAKELGISRPYVYAWIKGEREISNEYRGKIVELALHNLGKDAEEFVYSRIAKYLARLQNSLKKQGFFFSFGKSKLPIEAFIENAEEKVDFATFSVDPIGFKKILEWGAKNDIKVRVAYAMSNNREEVIKVANKGGVELKPVKNLHAKFAVIDDGEAAIVTSCNLSNRSLDFKGNVEVCTAFKFPEISNSLSEIFNRIWNGYSLDRNISLNENENIEILWNKGSSASYLKKILGAIPESDTLTIASQAWNPAVVSFLKDFTINSEVKVMVSSGGWGKETKEGIEELLNWQKASSNLEIYKVPKLHAKIISSTGSNPSVIMGSLNFSSSSFECRAYEVGVIIKEKSFPALIEPSLSIFCNKNLRERDLLKKDDNVVDHNSKYPLHDSEVVGYPEIEKLIHSKDQVIRRHASKLNKKLQIWRNIIKKKIRKKSRNYAKISFSNFKNKCEEGWKFPNCESCKYLSKRIKYHLCTSKKNIVKLEVLFDSYNPRLYYGTLNAIYNTVNNLDWLRIRNIQVLRDGIFIKNINVEFIKEIDLEKLKSKLKNEVKSTRLVNEDLKSFLVVCGENDTVTVYDNGKVFGSGPLMNLVREKIEDFILEPEK